MALHRGKYLVNGFFVKEVPTGSINGTNKDFTLSSEPASDSSLLVFLDGLETGEYSRSGTTITMTSAPDFGQTVRVWYVTE